MCVLPKFAALLSKGLSFFRVDQRGVWPVSSAWDSKDLGDPDSVNGWVAVGSVTIGDRSVYILLSLTEGGEGRRGGVNLCKFPALGWP